MATHDRYIPARGPFQAGFQVASKPKEAEPTRRAPTPVRPLMDMPAMPAQPATRLNHPAWQPPGQPGQELMLLPGQMHLGTRVSGLRTLLGSCVAITLWHPVKRIGGMCHFLLPHRQRQAGQPLDGKFGNEAVEAMVTAMARTGTQPQDYHAHLYGGADTMPETSGLKFNIGERNIEEGWRLIDLHGFQLQGVDVGEDVPRTVALHLPTGEVTMRRGVGHAPRNAAFHPSSAKTSHGGHR